MIPDRDYFADIQGNLTEDPKKFAFQIATRGVHLDDKIASRHGIRDMLVSTGEPSAHRPVARMFTEKPTPKIVDPPVTEDQPQAEPEAEEPTAAAAKPAAKKEDDKGAKKK